MSPNNAIAGVLIGGQSRRMGTCKALLPIHETVFVDRIISVARTAADEVVLLGNDELSTPGSKGMFRLADEPRSGGPLAGLVPLLEYAGGRWALLIACDMPLIETAVLKRLLDACDESVDAVAFCVSNESGEYFPCSAVFNPCVACAARSELARSRSLQALLARVRCRVLKADAREVRSLRSFNSPAEYAELAGIGVKLATTDHRFR